MFLVLVARAPAFVWKVKRAGDGRIVNIEKTSQYVNHYWFHIMDTTWDDIHHPDVGPPRPSGLT